MKPTSRRLLAVAAVAVAALPLSAVPAAAGNASAARATCKVRAHAKWNRSLDTFTYRGTVSCDAVTRGTVKLWCFPVHRHTFKWHSHTADLIQNGPVRTSALSVGPATRSGTDGDTYKITCKMEFSTRPGVRTVATTAAFTL